jgi:hypothetical protein
MLADVAIHRKSITVAFNGAELLRLASQAGQANVSIPRHVRSCSGMPPWISRGAERSVTAQSQPEVRRSLERHSITNTVTDQEYAALRDQVSMPNGPGITLPQYIRTRCGFRVRYVSNPNTSDREEDEAWEILDRLGLNADSHFEGYRPDHGLHCYRGDAKLSITRFSSSWMCPARINPTALRPSSAVRSYGRHAP